MSATSGQFWTQQFMKVDGKPYMGVRVFHYVAGNTITNLDVWQDATMFSAHNNPVVGDVSGRVSFYGSGTYRLLVMSSTADGNLILYDWDPVELVHHTATVRAEDKAISLPAAYAAARGRIFGVVDGGGDVLSMWVQRTASAWASLVLQGTLTQMIEFAKGTDIASSADVTIPSDGNFFDITGTNNIETFSGFAGYPVIYTRTLDVLTFIHSSNLQMLSQMNRTTIANQITCWIHIGAGQWVELFFTTISMFGDNNVTDGAVLLGNGTSAVTELALPTNGRALSHVGSLNGGIDPAWMTGLLYHGPTDIVVGSTRSHEATTIITAPNTNLSGIHYYSDFTVNAGSTVIVPAGAHRLVIVASNSITINGAINAAGAGSGQSAHAFSQAGGGGGGHTSGTGITTATAGGSAIVHSMVLSAGGGGGGQNATGGTPAALSGSGMAWADLRSVYGGAGGGHGGFASGGSAGFGGTGGGSIVLIAPTITFGSGSSLITAGNDGGAGANAGGGGGGGGGNIYMLCQTYTDNGATFTHDGGTGGGATGGGGGGGNGAAGVRQIMVYGV